MSEERRRLWDKGQPLNEGIHRFTVGNDPTVDLEIARWDVLASAAHAKMLAKIGVLERNELALLLAALKGILKDCDCGNFIIPPSLEDCHTAIEALLVENAGEAALKIHTGRSRNDQVLTALRLYMRSQLGSLLEKCFCAAEAILARQNELFSCPMPGYSHTQPAMPTSVGFWLEATAEALIDAVKDGLALMDRLNANPLGTGSGFGVPLPVDRKYTAELLGFARVQRNPIAVQNSRGRVELQVVRWISDIALVLEKFASDFILFSSREFGFFSLPESFTTGSSLMPQKRNPDVLELIRASAPRIYTSQFEILGILSKLSSGYHRDFQLIKEPLIRSVKTVDQLLPVFKEIVGSFSINEETLKQAMTPDLFLTYEIFQKTGLGTPFREAYRLVAAEKHEMDVKELKRLFGPLAIQLDEDTVDARNELLALKTDLKLMMSNWTQREAKVFDDPRKTD